jgi:hypothetical protein
VRGEWRLGRWRLLATQMLALGDMHQRMRINGFLQTNDFNGLGAVQTFPGAYFALPSNIGNYSQDRFAVVPETTLSLGYQVTRRLRVFLGYTFLYMSNVARPGDQMSHTINPSQGPAFTGLPSNTLVGSAAPTFPGSQTDFWIQGLNVGIEFRH